MKGMHWYERKGVDMKGMELHERGEFGCVLGYVTQGVS